MKRLLAVLLILGLPLVVLGDVVGTNVTRTQGGSGGGISFGGDSGGTATRVLFSDGSGNLADDADLTFSTDTLTATKIGSTTLTGTNLATGRTTFGTAADAATTLDLGLVAGVISWEGAAADTAEATLGHAVNAGFDTVTTIPALGAAQTLAVTTQSQTFAGTQTIGSLVMSGASFLDAAILLHVGGTSGNTVGGVRHSTNVSPAGFEIFSGTTSESIRIRQKADIATDQANGGCGTAACTNLQLIVMDKDGNTTDYQMHGNVGFTGKFTVTLAESSATSVLSVPVADNTSVSGTLQAKVFASDGTDHQARSTLLRYVVVNEGDTETCTIGTVAGAAACGASCTEITDGNLAAITSGTLTYTWACTAGTNAVSITLNAVSSLTQTTLSFEGQNYHTGGGEPLPQ